MSSVSGETINQFFRACRNGRKGDLTALIQSLDEDQLKMVWEAQRETTMQGWKTGLKFTLLMEASGWGYIQIVSELLKSGAPVNGRGGLDLTALMVASREGHDEVVVRLLKHTSIDLNLKTSQGWTALHYASYYGHPEVAALLLEQPSIEPNLKVNDGRTALHMASYNGHHEVVVRLLEHTSIDLNLQDSLGWTALHYASRYGHQEVAAMLLQHPSIETNLKTNEGNTALIFAARMGHQQIVALLLQHRSIDLNLRDNYGFWYGSTALDWAKNKGHATIVEMLQRAQLGGQQSMLIGWLSMHGMERCFDKLNKACVWTPEELKGLSKEDFINVVGLWTNDATKIISLLQEPPEPNPNPLKDEPAEPSQNAPPPAALNNEEEEDLCKFLETLKLGNYAQQVHEVVGATTKNDLIFFTEREWELMASIMMPFQLKKIQHALSTSQPVKSIPVDVPMPNGKKFHVFISHKKEFSEELAVLITSELSSTHNLKCFFDRDHLMKITEEELASSVQLSCVVLVVLDHKTIESDWCKIEWKTAHENGIPILSLYSKDHYNDNQFREVINAFHSHEFGFVVEHSAIEYTVRNRHKVLADLCELIKSKVG